MAATRGEIRVLDIPASTIDIPTVIGSAFDAWGAPFVADAGLGATPLHPGDRLLAVDAASLLTAPPGSIERHIHKLQRYGGKVVVQRVLPEEFSQLGKVVSASAVQRGHDQNNSQDLCVRPLQLLGAPAESSTVTVLPFTVERLQQHARAFGRLEGKLVILEETPGLGRLSTGDVVLELDGRSMLALHDPLQVWKDLLVAAVPKTVLLTVVRGPSPSSAPRPAVAAPLSLSPELGMETLQAKPQAAHRPVDAALLKRLDQAHLRLQRLSAVEFPVGSCMPDVRSLPDMRSPEAREAHERLRFLGVVPSTQACAYTLQLPLAALPDDLGFALGAVPDPADDPSSDADAPNPAEGAVLVHSVWGAAAKKAGLRPGLTLVAANGEDVTSASPVRILKMLSVALMSPVQRRSNFELRVVPCSARLSHLWAASAPRHVLLRTMAALPTRKEAQSDPDAVARRFGIEALAGAGRPTMAFVSIVMPDTPAGRGAVQSADRIAAINGVKIHGVTYDGIREMMVAHASSSRFLLLELHGNHAGYGLFQPREVMVTRTNVQGSDIGVFGFVVAGATTRTSDRRRAAGVYVWHVHEPALCGQLVPGDRILQVRNNMTTLSTVRDVHRLLQQGPSEMLLTVRNDPVGYSALKAEIGETGSSADGLLSQRLLDSGLALEAPTPESLAMHPGASTPVASAHFGAARASTCARRERPAEHQARTVIERMQKRVLSEQTANMKMSDAVNQYGQRWRQEGLGKRTQKTPATPPMWQAERPMASTVAVFTPVLQSNAAPSPDVSLASTPLLRRIGVRGPP